MALMAYLMETPGIEEGLRQIRLSIRDKFHLATTVGYGPRFLHSTGQFHKGGPNTGLFLQLTADSLKDLQIPGKSYTFAVFKQAQAQGDLEALRKHGRRVLRIHLGSDAIQGMKMLIRRLESAQTGGRS